MDAIGQKITVTEAHIIGGYRMSCNNCPIALAVKEVFPGELVSVNHSYIRIGGDIYQTPSSASRFISEFDHRTEGRKQRGFSFTIKRRFSKSASEQKAVESQTVENV